jgi:hypothetical protein
MLYPGGEKRCDVIQCLVKNEQDKEEAFGSMNRFLNAYARAHGVYFRWECGSCGDGFGDLSDKELLALEPLVESSRYFRRYIPYFTDITRTINGEQEVALALLNEARASHNPFYQFLCYWKILALRSAGQGKGYLVGWINKMLVSGLLDIPSYLRNVKDIGLFLKDSCNNAIKHIDNAEAVISYSEVDLERVKYGNYVMDQLVEYYLKNELKIHGREGINVLHIE